MMSKLVRSLLLLQSELITIWQFGVIMVLKELPIIRHPVCLIILQ
jgi:hypothetical protein